MHDFQHMGNAHAIRKATHSSILPKLKFSGKVSFSIEVLFAWSVLYTKALSVGKAVLLREIVGAP